jgi:hypothetical protein
VWEFSEPISTRLYDNKCRLQLSLCVVGQDILQLIMDPLHCGGKHAKIKNAVPHIMGEYKPAKITVPGYLDAIVFSCPNEDFKILSTSETDF